MYIFFSILLYHMKELTYYIYRVERGCDIIAGGRVCMYIHSSDSQAALSIYVSYALPTFGLFLFLSSNNNSYYIPIFAI
jgi:hypothetical protein